MMKKMTWRAVLPVLLAVALAGCDGTATTDAEAPVLLTHEAFELDAALFEDADAGPDRLATEHVGRHFVAAALRVWPVAFYLNAKYLLIPAVATAAAVEAEPVLDGGRWVWATQTDALPSPLTFELESVPSGDVVDWAFVITSYDAYTGLDDDFVLYTAQTAVGGGEGSWSLFYPDESEERVNVLNAAFTVAGPTDREIRFSVPADAQADYAGDAVTWSRDGEVIAFTWEQGDQEHRITWNRQTGAGSIEADDYRDGARYCWDAALSDISCTP